MMKSLWVSAVCGVLPILLLTARVEAHAAPALLLSENYRVAVGFSDERSGQSDSISMSSQHALAASLGYTSYYEDFDGSIIPMDNSWASEAGQFYLSVTGSAGLAGGTNAPFGTMSAEAQWAFWLITPGENLLQLHFVVENYYIDELDANAITLSLRRNGELWADEVFPANPGMTPEFWTSTLMNNPGDIWELTVRVDEAAWDSDFVRVVASANLTAIAIPESSHLGIFLVVASVLMHRFTRPKRGLRSRL